jgi:hypothetical protein
MLQADWKIVERGWHAHVLGQAPHKFPSALEAIKKLRVRRFTAHVLLVTTCCEGALRMLGADHACGPCIGSLGSGAGCLLL